jgi:hypothetical protein
MVPTERRPLVACRLRIEIDQGELERVGEADVRELERSG